MELISSFTWLDYSEHERRKMVEVIRAFSEQGTRDELGVGTIRDGIADLLFPGTGTVQTRARYFFFIPWLYQELEQRQASSRDIPTEERKRETELIYALEKGGERGTGVIGVEARDKLKRLPSNIYWQGLGAWGIRRFPGSQDQYHRSLDSWYRQKSECPVADKGESSAGKGPTTNWHPGLPQPEKGWRWSTQFKLTHTEARFLQDGISNFTDGSLLAHLVSLEKQLAEAEFCWSSEAYRDFPKLNRDKVDHARAFSEVIHGAALLYNLLLAEKADQVEWVSGYQDEMEAWGDILAARSSPIGEWDVSSFWGMIEGCGIRVPKRTRSFLNEWMQMVQVARKPKSLRDNQAARRLIRDREIDLKKGLARLENPRALELWTGAAGTGRLDFRWGISRILVNDILEGLGRA